MGWVGVLGSDKGLLRVSLPQPSASEALKALGGMVKGAARAPGRLEGAARRLKLYFGGHRTAFPDKIDISLGTPFQQEVWRQTRLIPYAEIRSYRDLAGQTGRPGAARAVGRALAKNPLPVVIPCHRVVTSSGRLGGFSGGRGLKRQLLDLEAGSGHGRHTGRLSQAHQRAWPGTAAALPRTPPSSSGPKNPARTAQSAPHWQS